MNTSRADIYCVLETANSVGEAPRSTQPVILCITVNIIPLTLYNSPPSVPLEDDDPLFEGATTLGRIQLPTPERPSPLSHYESVETGNKPQSHEEVSPTSIANPRLALYRTDEAMKRIIPNNRSNWERAVRSMKWVMDKLSPIAEHGVRMMPF